MHVSNVLFELINQVFTTIMGLNSCMIDEDIRCAMSFVISNNYICRYLAHSVVSTAADQAFQAISFSICHWLCRAFNKLSNYILLPLHQQGSSFIFAAGCGSLLLNLFSNSRGIWCWNSRFSFRFGSDTIYVLGKLLILSFATPFAVNFMSSRKWARFRLLFTYGDNQFAVSNVTIW